MAGRKVWSPNLIRLMFRTTSRTFSENTSSQNPPQVNTPGLSKNVVSVPASEVGPGASKQSNYKNPEYFCYSNMSYFEAEVEMNKYRMKQPSNKSPLLK